MIDAADTVTKRAKLWVFEEKTAATAPTGLVCSAVSAL
jgi:hypothetical protein